MSAAAGTGWGRARLRARQTVAAVSTATATHAIPCSRASVRQRVRRSASIPVVSTTVVSPRATRRATISSSSANASVLAAMSSSPAPTTPRSASDETTAEGGKFAAAHVDFPDAAGPASTTRHGEGSSSDTAASLAYGRRRPPLAGCPTHGVETANSPSRK